MLGTTDKVWKWIYPRYQQELRNNNIIFKRTKTSGLVDQNGNQSPWNIYNKLWLSEQKDKGVVPSNFISEFENRQSLAEMKKLGINFTYAKPTNLIKYLITVANQPADITVLDCFAGSGTTGHAVLKLNVEDGGHRKFILCTNNENDICEKVTYERMCRVINGYDDVDGISSNLKYYHTTFVSKDEEDVSEALLSHITEMVQLENGVKLDGKEYILVMNDDEADTLEQRWNEYPNIKALYVSKNVLFTIKQNALFRNVEIHIIPDYYFKFEMQEVGEAW